MNRVGRPHTTDPSHSLRILKFRPGGSIARSMWGDETRRIELQHQLTPEGGSDLAGWAFSLEPWEREA